MFVCPSNTLPCMGALATHKKNRVIESNSPSEFRCYLLLGCKSGRKMKKTSPLPSARVPPQNMSACLVREPGLHGPRRRRTCSLRLGWVQVRRCWEERRIDLALPVRVPCRRPVYVVWRYPADPERKQLVYIYIYT